MKGDAQGFFAGLLFHDIEELLRNLVSNVIDMRATLEAIKEDGGAIE